MRCAIQLKESKNGNDMCHVFAWKWWKPENISVWFTSFFLGNCKFVIHIQQLHFYEQEYHN
jgi:hypothetical protein